MYHDKRFQYDKQFSLVTFNHEQIKFAMFEVYVMTKRANFNSIVNRIMNANVDVIYELASRMKTEEHVSARTLEEKLCFDLINDLDVVGQRVSGSPTIKRYMRSEIWSIISERGAPSWFITFSPPDSKNPICLYYADERVTFGSIGQGDDERYRLIANNSVASARYFHFMVTLFIKHVLGVDSNHDGLFGRTFAYYGTVEQQARLTLHLHLLLWIENSPTPEEIRRRVLDPQSEFRTRMISYLEAVHRGGFLTGDKEDVKDYVDKVERCRAKFGFSFYCVIISKKPPLLSQPNLCSNRVVFPVVRKCGGDRVQVVVRFVDLI